MSGWNGSTTGATERDRAAWTRAEPQPPCKAAGTGKQPYVSPVQRVERMISTMREHKRAQRGQKAALEARWGAEGVQALHDIEQMLARRGGYHPRQTKVTKADRAAVEALDAAVNDEAFGVSVAAEAAPLDKEKDGADAAV